MCLRTDERFDAAIAATPFDSAVALKLQMTRIAEMKRQNAETEYKNEVVVVISLGALKCQKNVFIFMHTVR